ncbi:MAG: hypothetical protein AAFP00_01390 [Bacteroidota bacterium]
MPKPTGAMGFTILVAAVLITGCANPFQKACEDEITSSEDVGRYAYKYFGEGHPSFEHFVRDSYELKVFHQSAPNSSVGFNYRNLKPRTARFGEVVYLKVDVSKCGKPKVIGRTGGM